MESLRRARDIAFLNEAPELLAARLRTAQCMATSSFNRIHQREIHNWRGLRLANVSLFGRNWRAFGLSRDN